MTFASFATWDEVLVYVRTKQSIYYQAPMDRKPKYVAVVRQFKNGKLRIDPLTNQADPFTADREHLPRFRRMLLSNT